MGEQSVDARLDDRASSFWGCGEKLGELLQLGGFLGRDGGPLGLGVHLGVGAEGEHEVALDLALVRQAAVADVAGAASSGLHHVIPVGRLVEHGEVLHPLRACAHHGLADVAESGGFGEHPRLVAVERDLDDLDDGADRLIHRRTGRVLLGGNHRVLQLFDFCHECLQYFCGPALNDLG